jgi:uncharacterized protein (TIGR03067 family)
VSARAAIISWALAGVVIVTLLVGSQVLASRRALMASMRAREAEAMARREFMEANLVAQLQPDGEWEVVSQTVSGRDTTEAVKGTRLSFRGDRLIRTEPDGSLTKKRVQFRPQANPKEVDLMDDTPGVSGVQQQLGIYRVDGRKLIMSFNRADPTKRPKGYVSAPENTIEVTVLEELPPSTETNLEKSP